MGVDSSYSPYLGPRPFENAEQDIDRFFGREREIRDISSLIIAQPTLLLYGKSGTGKTSLLNAGIIPRLQRKGVDVILPRARVQSVIADNISLSNIQNIYMYNVLVSWVQNPINIPEISQLSLADFLRRRKHYLNDDGEPSLRIAILDQFEELFTAYPQYWSQREAFFRQISDALESDPFLRIVFVMREDYIADLDPYISLLPSKLGTRFRLERLRRDQARLAVVRPVEITKRTYADGAAEKLIEELLTIRDSQGISGEGVTTEEFVEPVVLQVVCENLWKTLPSKVKKISQLKVEKLAKIEDALLQFYEDCVFLVVERTRITEEKLRDWFEKTLITAAGTRGMVYQGKTETGGIPNEVVALLEIQHIIRREQRAQAQWYELAHDRFINAIIKSNKRYQEEANIRLLESVRIQAKATQGKGATILVADNNRIFLRKYAAWLSASGYAVLAAASPQEVRKILESGRNLDLVILDERLLDDESSEDKSGYSLARDTTAAHIPTLLMTWNPSFELIRHSQTWIQDSQSRNIFNIIGKFEIKETFIAVARSMIRFRNVCIVGFNNMKIRNNVELFIMKLGLEPLILDNRPNVGRTVIEQLEHFQLAHIVTLVTPDDISSIKGDLSGNLRLYSNRNPMFELGYFIGKFGRHRVSILLDMNETTSNVRLPTDVAGISYIPMDESGRWEQKLFRELMSSGLKVQYP